MRVADAPSNADRFRKAFEDSLGIPFSNGNAIEVLRNGVEIFPSMIAAIDAAEATIEFVTYVYWRGTIARAFAEACTRAAGRGVEVRFLVDAFGGRSMEKTLIRGLREAGAEFRWFRPLSKIRGIRHRTHRKILVCDGRVGFTGGVGIADEWEGDAKNPREWRDSHFRIEGPAVRGLRAAFLGNWIETDGSLHDLIERPAAPSREGKASVQVVRSAGSEGWGETSVVIWTLALLARQSIRITTAYFVPDLRTSRFLEAAAKRGVSIELILPGKHRTDSYLSHLAGTARYGSLLNAGIRIYEFQPTMLHTKTITVDDTVAWLGSPNLNQRSMRQDDEIGLLAIDPDTCARLDRHFEDDRARSVEVTLGDWNRRNAWQRAKEWIVDPFRSEL
ncbi:MAG: cardiolipin synthase B [Myxococcales bacterium]|nr:cardiolipin synthase B [Myxococcales bacterium]